MVRDGFGDGFSDGLLAWYRPIAWRVQIARYAQSIADGIARHTARDLRDSG